jgi:UrcA family protein
MHKLFSSVVLAASMAVAAPALAESEALPSAKVHTADLDLTSAAGRETFQGRVKSAAARVCGRAPTSPLIEARGIHACHSAVARSADRGMATAMAKADRAAQVRGTH